MSTRFWTYAICLGCAAYLATEALPRPLPPVGADSPSPRSAATTAPRTDARRGSVAPVAAAALLDRGVATLKDAQWLRLTIRQKQYGGAEAAGFEAESRLLLGPDGCARLDLAVGAGPAPVRKIIISDGRALAIVSGAEGKKQVVGFKLPQAADIRTEILRRHGCSGPHGLLERVRGAVGPWEAHEVVRAGRPLVRMTAAVSAPERLEGTVAGAGWCRLDLDPATGWPERLEIGRGAVAGREQAFELEFCDAAVNQALSEAECAQLFSYRPH